VTGDDVASRGGRLRSILRLNISRSVLSVVGLEPGADNRDRPLRAGSGGAGVQDGSALPRTDWRARRCWLFLSSRPSRAVGSAPGRIDAGHEQMPVRFLGQNVGRVAIAATPGALVKPVMSVAVAGRGGWLACGSPHSRPPKLGVATLGGSSSGRGRRAAAGRAEPLRSPPGCVALGGRLRGVDGHPSTTSSRGRLKRTNSLLKRSVLRSSRLNSMTHNDLPSLRCDGSPPPFARQSWPATTRHLSAGRS
jgi:hypothetical protein